jgi:hypothetical protein
LGCFKAGKNCGTIPLQEFFMKRHMILVAVLFFIFAVLIPGQAGAQKKSDPDTGPKPGFQTLAGLLNESIDMTPINQNPVVLKEVLDFLNDRLAAKSKDFSIFIDVEAFKEENPDAEAIQETRLQFQPVPKKQKVERILRQALSQVRPANATYLLRGGMIEITTFDRAKPEVLLGVPITGRFNKRPLDEVIDDLSNQSGATIIIDSRIGDKAKTPVSVSFKNTITLEAAVRLLAEMADLQTEIRDNILFVTGKAKADGGPQKSEIHFKGQRLDLALRELANWSGANIVLDPRYTPPPTPINQRRQKRIEAVGLEKQLETVALQVGALGIGGIGMPYEPLDPRNMRVTASFKPNVSAETAARILANQVQLSVAVLGNVLYVTDPTNADRLLKEKSGKYPSSGFFLPGISK